MSLEDSVVHALAVRGFTVLVRPARADRRGVTLAELCEQTEGDRAWDTHWDGCPFRVIGYVSGRSR